MLQALANLQDLVVQALDGEALAIDDAQRFRQRTADRHRRPLLGRRRGIGQQNHLTGPLCEGESCAVDTKAKAVERVDKGLGLPLQRQQRLPDRGIVVLPDQGRQRGNRERSTRLGTDRQDPFEHPLIHQPRLPHPVEPRRPATHLQSFHRLQRQQLVGQPIGILQAGAHRGHRRRQIKQVQGYFVVHPQPAVEMGRGNETARRRQTQAGQMAHQDALQPESGT